MLKQPNGLGKSLKMGAGIKDFYSNLFSVRFSGIDVPFSTNEAHAQQVLWAQNGASEN